MKRLIIQVPELLLKLIDKYRPEGQSRSEWIRHTIRQRLTDEAKLLSGEAEMSRLENQG